MGDEHFVHEVHRASYRRLVGQLVGVTGSLAEAGDVVQEAFVRALNNARTFRGTDNPEAWLRRVSVNLAPKLVAPERYDDLSPETVLLSWRRSSSCLPHRERRSHSITSPTPRRHPMRDDFSHTDLTQLGRDVERVAEPPDSARWYDGRGAVAGTRCSM